MNRLHPELLSHIFILGQEQQEIDVLNSTSESIASSSSIDDPTEHPFAMVVSQVSKRWRNIAIDTANLWTKIDFAEAPPYEYSKLLLQRSKNAPLNIVLSLSEADNKAGIDVVMKLIVPEHSMRVTTLGINAISLNQIDWILSNFITESDTPPPIVDLSLTEADAMGELVQISVAPQKMQQLIKLTAGIERLALDGVQLPWHSPAFSNLTRLRLASNPHTPEEARPTESQFIAILNASPLLESLYIGETGIQMDDPTRPDHCKRHASVRMVALRSIELVEISWNEMLFILHVISAPGLTRLHISAPEERNDSMGNVLDDDMETVDGAVCTAVTQFLQKTARTTNEKDHVVTSPVESLELEALTGEEIGSERLTSMLLLVPRLRHLSLIDLAFDDDVLNQMHGVWGPHADAGTANRGVLCPDVSWLKLSHIHFISEEGIYDCGCYGKQEGNSMLTLRLFSGFLTFTPRQRLSYATTCGRRRRQHPTRESKSQTPTICEQ